MSPAGRHSELIAEAQASLRRVRAALVAPAPQALESTIPHLEAALACLRQLEGCLPAGPQPAHLLPEVSELRRLANSVRALLDGAAAFHLGWARLLASAAGYTAQGEAALAAPAPQVSVQA